MISSKRKCFAAIAAAHGVLSCYARPCLCLVRVFWLTISHGCDCCISSCIDIIASLMVKPLCSTHSAAVPCIHAHSQKSLGSISLTDPRRGFVLASAKRSHLSRPITWGALLAWVSLHHQTTYTCTHAPGARLHQAVDGVCKLGCCCCI